MQIGRCFMRKKIVCILVALVLCFCTVGLTACFIPFIPQNNDSEQETEKNNNVDKNTNTTPETPNTGTDDKEEDSSSTTTTIFVKGKTFVFDIIAVQHLSVIYPEVVLDNAVYEEDEEAPLTNEENMLTLQMLQEQVNDMYDTYYGSTLTFKDGGVVEHKFVDGIVNEYKYKQSLYNIAIGDLVNEDSTLTGQVDKELLILQMYLNDYTVFYLQFVVQK